MTLVVVNKGKLSHALAIFGAGKLKRTPTLKPDATTVRRGELHVPARLDRPGRDGDHDRRLTLSRRGS